MELEIKNLNFQHQTVRDLAWVMSSPGLLKTVPKGLGLVNDSFCARCYAQGVESLRELDKNPQVLQQWLAQRSSHRLGVYFETLLIFWMMKVSGIESIRCNVPVFRVQAPGTGRQTLGEFDVLLTLPGEKVARHWEAAVKFYLRWHDDSGAVKWVGPAGRDRFDLKLDRMFTHQMVLSRKPEGKDLLDKLGFNNISCEAFVKGYLFYPAHEQSPLEDDALMSPHHLRGWWLRHGESEFPQQHTDSRWYIVPRLQWLSPLWITLENVSLLQDKNQLMKMCAQHFSTANEELLVAEMLEVEAGWYECARGFIVGKQWPHLTI